MSDTWRAIGIVALVVGACIVLHYWGKQNMSPSSGMAANAGATDWGPAYVDTAADNSVDVAGVPEESVSPKCPGMHPSPDGASREGGYTCQ
jgi:hypothetical protein